VLTGFLLAFYRGLGLEACYAVDAAPEGERLGERTAFCFAGRESFDILVGGGKLGGNAQRRQKGIVFQHGSIPLVNRARTGLSYMREGVPEDAMGVTSLEDAGVVPPFVKGGRNGEAHLRTALKEAFRVHFGVALREDGLTTGERSLAEGLFRDKYSSENWNLEGEGA
jgi:lipoate-protein ligase A